MNTIFLVVFYLFVYNSKCLIRLLHPMTELYPNSNPIQQISLLPPLLLLLIQKFWKIPTLISKYAAKILRRPFILVCCGCHGYESILLQFIKLRYFKITTYISLRKSKLPIILQTKYPYSQAFLQYNKITSRKGEGIFTKKNTENSIIICSKNNMEDTHYATT